MKLKKEIQTIFNNTTVNQNRVDAILKLIEREQKGFAEMLLKRFLDVDELSEGQKFRLDYDLKEYVKTDFSYSKNDT